MAIKIYNDITLDSNQIKDVSLERLSANPTGFEGQIYYNTAENAIRYYDGSAWIELDGAGDVTTVTANNGLKITGGDATNPVVEVDYGDASNNIIASAGAGTTLLATDTFLGNDSGTVKEFTIQKILNLASSAVTSLTLAVGADSTGSPLTGSGTTGNITLSSRPYNGGSNIGFVPSGGGSTTFLNGAGNWTTPIDTTASWDAEGDSGSQTISNGSTLDFIGGTGITTALTANTLTTTLALTELTANTTAAAGTDRVAGIWSGSQGTKQLQGIPINLFATPTGAIAMGSNKITGLADPSNPQDAATKAYVDAQIVGGLNYIGTYNASTNIPVLTGASNIASAIGDVYSVDTAGDFGPDAVAVEDGDLIIVTTTITAASNPPNSSFSIVQNNIDLATNSVAGIAQFPTGNGFATFTNGVVKLSAGDEKTAEGSTSESLTITTDAFGKITAVDAAAISITTGDITNFDAAVNSIITDYSETITFGDAALSSFPLNHSLATRDVMVQVYDTSTYDTVECSVERNLTTQITIDTGSYIPGASALAALITKIV